MIKNFLWGKLKLKLILCIVLAFILSLGLFLLLQVTGEDILDNYLSKTSFIENQQKRATAEFKSYVSENNLTLQTDQDKITDWVRDAKYVNIYIYSDNKLIFATDGYTTSSGTEQPLLSPVLKNKPIDRIEFSDISAQIYMECFFEYKYYYIVVILNGALTFLFFVIIMLFFINRKTSYIAILDNEIKILEGGNLDYPITINGKDELTSLAQSINEMRKSFIERLESEDRARMANSELVTAMSHDLRTPLTALVGYLDIIEYKKYKTDEDLNKYIRNSREKAYQIKQLSDKLFEYFTVFNTDDNELELDLFDGIQLIDQLIDEQLLILQNNGFHFQYHSCETPFTIEVHLISIRRVFDNIFSNITKYADKSKPVKINCYLKHQLLFIDIENDIKSNLGKVSSTGIGMKTCERIIKMHNGKIAVTRTKEIYSLHISLAVKK